MTGGTDWPGRAAWRVAETGAAAGRLDRLIRTWFAERRVDPRFQRFGAHFDFLEPALITTIGLVRTRLTEPGETLPGDTYERCRQIERALLMIQRLFEWYAEKYDQRRHPRFAGVLAAADEVVRSCWAPPFAQLGLSRPTGPLTYVAPRWGACALIRRATPSALKQDTSEVVRHLVRELPVPIVAIGEAAVAQGWWLTLIAHEVGHHLEHDLESGLAERVVTAVAQAAGPDLGGVWSSWSGELFADVYAAVTTGDATAWALHELEYATPAELFGTAGPGGYPPPAVRLAVTGEAVRRLGHAGWAPDAEQVRAWWQQAAGARPAITGDHLTVAPAVAESLLTLPVHGRQLPELAGHQQKWFRPGGRVANWAEELTAERPELYPRDGPESARLAVAAGVRAYRDAARTGADQTVVDRLHDNLVSAVSAAGPGGVLAGPAGLSADPVAAAAAYAEIVLSFSSVRNER
jgi:hypothetical protein